MLGVRNAGSMTSRLRRMQHWGATDAEVAASYPGDELTRDARNVATRAVTVRAPASAVWPWLQQIDQQRGGFYSYRWLENLVGCRMPKVERLVPEWGERTVGEKMWMTPPDRFKGNGHMVVARVDHERALAMLSPDLYDGRPPASGVSGSWTFWLVPIDDHTCRLIVRSRYMRPNIAFDAIHFMMEWRMMRTIARLAATTPSGRAAPRALRPS
jgi:hypothetical protein